MSGAIHIEFSSSLLAALDNKVNELPGRFLNLVNESALITQRQVIEESPFITHNLQGATTVEPTADYERLIFPDLGRASYALYVILQGIKRNYPGNPYFDRGKDNAEPLINQEVEAFEQWLSNIE
jgi:hypothetical protein